ncbi:PREDICTED: uncharacterized protein LOC104803589 [Tarenaya hassleriana]|uniref:uncharacterized protein LOC104803589 n=1 Tax=Tarenaya hassleriana TaxID=28532 RepID=UPI00053C516B|nr:PREDICTED: uncharacterized protein LOC104803589 [Tarenaya hassleriana]
MATWISFAPPNSFYLRLMPPPASASGAWRRRRIIKPINCGPSLEQQQDLQLREQDGDEAVILCELCNGKGWLLCDFCKGQKTNVQAENKRIYRRCPSCKAVGCVLCTKCKVFKCVTFPNPEDGVELQF